MNQALFVGRLAREVESVEVSGGRKVINNVLAVNRNHKDKEGDYVTDFIPLVAWNQAASIMERFCHKGQQVAIRGRMRSRSYQGKDKITRYVVECIVEEVTLLARVKKERPDGMALLNDELVFSGATVTPSEDAHV